MLITGIIAGAILGALPTEVPVNVTLPSIVAEPQPKVGETLSFQDDTWTNSPTSFSYQWYRDDVAISGATGAQYTLVAADEGTMIHVEVVATNNIGSSAPAASVAVGPIEASVTVPSYVNTSVANSNSGTSLTLNLPANIVAGNVLIAITTIVSTRNPVWPAGWTAIGDGHSAYRIADGNDTAPTVTWDNSATQAGYITQWTDTSGVGALNDNQAQSGTPATCPAITTTADNSLIAALIISGSGTIPTNPSGFTSEYNSSDISSALRIASQERLTMGTLSDAISSDVNSGAVWRTCLVELLA